MTCYRPLQAWLTKPDLEGKRSVTFAKSEADQAHLYSQLNLPCGQCIGCKLQNSQNWAVRCIHEASQYDKNCFITLTYNDENIPKNGSLDKTEFQLFMKRLRKEAGKKIRFFHCGEYGSQLLRPHYHACIFNLDFQDKNLHTINNGNKIYTSPTLQKLWNKGFSTIGDLTEKSASYVARYCTKKINGKEAEKHYNGKLPEYVTMSRNPGIGSDWYKKYKTDVFPSDQIILNGKILTVPRFYANLLKKEKPIAYEALMSKRVKQSSKTVNNILPDGRIIPESNNSLFRLRIREKIKCDRTATLKRNMEDSNGIQGV